MKAQVPFPRRPTEEERQLKPTVAVTLDEGGAVCLLDKEQALTLVQRMIEVLAKDAPG